MLTTSFRTSSFDMSPAALPEGYRAAKRADPISILKKAESDTSSTCSTSSMITCSQGCKQKVLNTQLQSHDCFQRMRQELNDSYGRIDDLEEELRLVRETHQQTELILRNQIKRLRNELEERGEKIHVVLSRENRTFGFKLLGREQGEEGAEGVSIASLTHGSPAQKSGKILVGDKILEINSRDVDKSTCSEVEGMIRNSPDSIRLVLLRTASSTHASSANPSSASPSPRPDPSSTRGSTSSEPSTNLSLPSSRPAASPGPRYSTPRLPTSLTYRPSSEQRSEHGTPDHVTTDNALPVTSDRHNNAPVTHSNGHVARDGVGRLPSRLLSDEDWDRLSAVDVPADYGLDSSHSSEISELSQEAPSPQHLGNGHASRESPEGGPRPLEEEEEGSRQNGAGGRGEGSSLSGVSWSDSGVNDLTEVLTHSREYETVLLEKQDGMLGITLTYGTDTLQGLFVDSIKPGSPAETAGKPLLHDQIVKVKGLEIGVDVMCDEAIALLTDNSPTVALELARPKKHDIRIKRNPAQSLGMMVAVSKLQDDKSVIISTVDPTGLVAKHGLFKGLTLHKVNGVELTGLGLKQAVEVLAGCAGDVTLTVFLHPSFSPYQPPRPPTPYPLLADKLHLDEEEPSQQERSVKFSLPPSPASTTASVESLPRDPPLSSSPHFKPPSPVRVALNPRSSPSINLINNDWSLDRSSDSSMRGLRVQRDQIRRGPVRGLHPQQDSLDCSFTRGPRTSPTPHPSLNTPNPSLNSHYTTPAKRTSPHLLRQLTTPHYHASLHQSSTPPPHPSLQTFQPPPSFPIKPPPQSTPSSRCSPASQYENLPNHDQIYENLVRPVAQIPGSRGRSPQGGQNKLRVLGRRERAARDRKVQLGGFQPIKPAPGDDEHYV